MRAATEFLRRLFEPYSPRMADGRISCEVRCLPKDAERSEIRQSWYGLEPEYLERAVQDAMFQRHGADVYVGVLPRIGRRGYANDVHFGAWLWADIDAGKAGGHECSALLKRADLPTPAMFVFTGSGGAHVYWRLSGFERFQTQGDRAFYTGILRRLTRHIGGQTASAHADPACADVARILRIPGTQNHKWNPPRPVQLVLPARCDMRPLTWWDENLPNEPQIRPQAERPFDSSGPGLRKWADDWSTTPCAHGGRHREMASTAAFLRREGGFTHDELHALLVRKAFVSPGPEIPLNEVEKIIRWASSKSGPS